MLEILDLPLALLGPFLRVVSAEILAFFGFEAIALPNLLDCHGNSPLPVANTPGTGKFRCNLTGKVELRDGLGCRLDNIIGTAFAA